MTEAGSHRAGVMSGAVGFASRGMVQVMLFGVTVVATRALSVAEFGAYALGSLLLVVARQLFYVGPYEYLLKAPDRAGLAGACLAANLVQSLVLAGLLGLAWGGARLFLADPLVAQILGLLIPSLFLVALAAWYEALLLRRGRGGRPHAAKPAGGPAGGLGEGAAAAAGSRKASASGPVWRYRKKAYSPRVPTAATIACDGLTGGGSSARRCCIRPGP